MCAKEKQEMAYSGDDMPIQGEKATTNEEIVALLQDDMKGEHAAIIQYLQHAYKIGEDAGEVPNEIEAISRDEMRHFRWLGELIVEFGGNPTMLRDPIFLDGPEALDLLALDVEAEQRAIDQYRDHIKAIDHPKVKTYLKRILMDEIFHQGKFREFIEEMGGNPAKEVSEEANNEDIGPWNKDPNPPSQDLELNAQGEAVPADMQDAGRNDHPLVRLLNSRIRQEYETILIYLHQAFVSQNPQQRNSLISDKAVWHMTHMGTLGEAVAGIDVRPDMELNFQEKFLEQAPTEPHPFNRWAISREEELNKITDELLALSELHQKDADEDLIADLKRINGHGKFQVEQLRFEEEK
jgi:bacterioferritin